MNKLLKCPFCGGEAKFADHRDGWYFIICKQCAAITAPKHTEEEAIATWNRRTQGWMNDNPEELYQGVPLLTVTSKNYEIAYYGCEPWEYDDDENVEAHWHEIKTNRHLKVICWMPLPEKEDLK